LRVCMTPTFFELKNAVVGVAGLGGLGSNVAVALARIGLGRLIIADFDVVDISNLNRQHYYLDQVGVPKVEATLANLRRINGEIGVAGHQVRLTAENIAQVFAGADVIAECFDRSEQKQMLVETVLSRMKAAIVSVSGIAGYGRSNEIVTRRISDRLVLVGDGVSATRPGVPLTAPRVGVAAHHQANAVVEIMLENGRMRESRSWQ